MGGISACGDARHAFRKKFALKISTSILTYGKKRPSSFYLFLLKKSELFVTKQVEQSAVTMIQGHSCLHINFKI